MKYTCLILCHFCNHTKKLICKCCKSSAIFIIILTVQFKWNPFFLIDINTCLWYSSARSEWTSTLVFTLRRDTRPAARLFFLWSPNELVESTWKSMKFQKNKIQPINKPVMNRIHINKISLWHFVSINV